MCDLERTESAPQTLTSLAPAYRGRGSPPVDRRRRAARAALAAAVLLAGGCRRDPAAGATSDARDSDPGGWTTQVFLPPLGQGLAWSGERVVAVGSPAGRWSSDDAKVWLEGNAFAWLNDVAWDGHHFAAVGPDAAVSVSSDGLTWTSASPSPSAPSLYGVASSGSRWVAVGSGGAILHAAASDPGNWSEWTLVAPSPTSKDLLAITWAGGQFVAVGRGGAVVSSPDGLNWALQPAATTSDLVSVAAASATSIVALTSAMPSQFLSSSDLKSWTATHAGVFGRVAFLNGQYLALGEYASATSADGVTWKTGNAPAILRVAIFDGQRYVATSDGAVLTSADGLVWEPLAIAAGTGAIARDPASGRMVAAGGDVLEVAPEGGEWAYRNLRELGIGPGDAFDTVIWAPALTAFGAMSIEGANQALFRSADAESWTRVGDAPCYAGLASSGSALVNIGSSLTGPCLATSTDGTSWSARTVPNDKLLTRAFWTGSAFVAVGPAGALATAPADGSVWTARSTGVAAALHGAAGTGARLIAVGDGGTILSSDDGGETWRPRTSGTVESLRSVIWTGTEFAAAGANATLLRSADGAAWRRQATPYTPGSFTYALDFKDLAWSPAERLLTVVGSNGFRATVP